MSIMTTADLRALHRWLGIIACLSALLWIVSGMLHPVLVRVQPQPVTHEHPALNFHYPIVSDISPAYIAQHYGIQTAVLLRTVWPHARF
jgi:hypothetical protein